MRRILFFVYIFLVSTHLHAQDPHLHHEKIRGFRMSAALGHTYLPKETHAGKDVAILPTFNIDVEYWFSHRLGVGFHNDLELLNFQIRDQENDLIIERDYPVLITFDVIYRLYKGLTVYAGPGVELEKNEDYFVTRFGLEYEIEMKNGWDVHPVLFYDFRRNAYNTSSIAIGFGKRF